MLTPPHGFRLLIFAPSVWAAQFLAVYVIAAVHCARFATAAMAGTRALMAGIAAVALALIVVHGVRGLRLWRQAVRGAVFDRMSQHQRFVGFTGFLLAVVSGIATLFGALSILMIHTCA